MLRHKTNQPYENPLQLLADVLFEAADRFADELAAWDEVGLELSKVVERVVADAKEGAVRLPTPSLAQLDEDYGRAVRTAYAEATACATQSLYVLSRARRLSTGIGHQLEYSYRYPGRIETRLRAFIADLSVRYERVDGIDSFGNARRLRRLTRTHVPRLLKWAAALEAAAVPPDGIRRKAPSSPKKSVRETTTSKISKVLSLIIQFPEMPATHYALKVGWHVKTLYKHEMIKTALQHRKMIGAAPPSGTKGVDGSIEACVDADEDRE